MKPDESTDWRQYFTKIGAILFITALPVTIAGSILFGARGVAWATVLMINPSLMMIGAAVGFGDLFQTFRILRGGELFAGGPFPGVFIIGRGLAFSSLFSVFLWLEVKIISSL